MSEPVNVEDLIQEFEPEGDQHVKNVSNEFLTNLEDSSGLKVLHKAHCIKKLRTQGYSGLASLFVGDQFLNSVWFESWKGFQLEFLILWTRTIENYFTIK